MQHRLHICAEWISEQFGIGPTQFRELRLELHLHLRKTRQHKLPNFTICFNETPSRSGTVRGGVWPPGPQSRKCRMVENEGPIIGCLIHSVTKYRGHNRIDACVRLSFPVLLVRKEISHHANRTKLRILNFCRWLQPEG